METKCYSGLNKNFMFSVTLLSRLDTSHNLNLLGVEVSLNLGMTCKLIYWFNIVEKQKMIDDEASKCKIKVL